MIIKYEFICNDNLLNAVNQGKHPLKDYSNHLALNLLENDYNTKKI